MHIIIALSIVSLILLALGVCMWKYPCYFDNHEYEYYWGMTYWATFSGISDIERWYDHEGSHCTKRRCKKCGKSWVRAKDNKFSLTQNNH